MIDSEILKEETEKYLIYKINHISEYINSFSFVEKCYFDGSDIIINFTEEIDDNENQNIFDVFIRGGVIKKKKEDDDVEYIEVNPIDAGELR
jgi:hypothetical protein